MRAVFIEASQLQATEVVLADERAHHLLNVVRLKPHETILMLDGEGLKAKAQVLELKKRELRLQILEKEICPKRELLHLALALPSREALEDVLRQSVELGIASIQPLVSEYSERNFELSPRLKRVMESALIQSNNPHFPSVLPLLSFDQYLEKLSKTQSYFLFTSRPKTSSNSLSLTTPSTMIIGPEGGFSSGEEEKLETRENVNFIHLPSYILRTPTAVTCASGFLFSKLS